MIRKMNMICCLKTNGYPQSKNGCQSWQPLVFDKNGRDGEIRTRDLTHPKRARYQAAPRPVVPELVSCQRTNVKRDAETFLLRSALVFLLEQRKQFAQLRSQLLQSLTLFRSAWRHRARVSRRL